MIEYSGAGGLTTHTNVPKKKLWPPLLGTSPNSGADLYCGWNSFLREKYCTTPGPVDRKWSSSPNE